MNQENIKSFSSCFKIKIDFIFIEHNENNYLINEKKYIKELLIYYRDLYNFIDKKIFCSKSEDDKDD